MAFKILQTIKKTLKLPEAPKPRITATIALGPGRQQHYLYIGMNALLCAEMGLTENTKVNILVGEDEDKGKFQIAVDPDGNHLLSVIAARKGDSAQRSGRLVIREVDWGMIGRPTKDMDFELSEDKKTITITIPTWTADEVVLPKPPKKRSDVPTQQPEQQWTPSRFEMEMQSEIPDASISPISHSPRTIIMPGQVGRTPLNDAVEHVTGKVGDEITGLTRDLRKLQKQAREERNLPKSEQRPLPPPPPRPDPEPEQPKQTYNPLGKGRPFTTFPQHNIAIWTRDQWSGVSRGNKEVKLEPFAAGVLFTLLQAKGGLMMDKQILEMNPIKSAMGLTILSSVARQLVQEVRPLGIMINVVTRTGYSATVNEIPDEDGRSD